MTEKIATPEPEKKPEPSANKPVADKPIGSETISKAQENNTAMAPSPLSIPGKKTFPGRIALAAIFVVFLFPALAAVGIILPLPLKETKTVVIPRGTAVKDIGLKLQGEGIAPNRLLFIAAARLLAHGGLQAGEYRFTPEQNLLDAVLMLRDGDSIVRMFTVAEGLTSAEIINLLKNDPVLTGNIKSTPPEGSLFPETYRYTYGDTRQSLIERMQKTHREQLNELWSKRDTSVPLKTPQEAVILASLIEKETGKKAEERPRVAGVFYNRLKIGMRLQSDPTVIYALTKGQKPLGRELTKEDLNCPSPFNTYVNAGLPPSPIANPGRDSLESALHPEKHDFMYFVADGTGGHAFAKDLAEHNKNVNKWLCLPKP